MKTPNSAVKRVVIVGGGAAGWLTAAILASTRPELVITLIESPDVRILGVGEGTWPTMRNTLQQIGISEQQFLTACDASFKQGTSFHNWLDDKEPHQYYHPFSLPLDYPNPALGSWWQHFQGQQSFAHCSTSQATLCDHFRAPKQPQTPPFAGVVNYGYHLDANKFAMLLQTHATQQLGVTHISDHIQTVNGSYDGPITSVTGRSQGDIHGDLFIDCSGFAARLIGQHYGIELLCCEQTLANNSAVAMPVNYQRENTDIASVTRSFAQNHGWIWDIALPTRKGIGYVYSDAHCSREEALTTLADYIRHDDTTQNEPDLSQARTFSFKPGYRETLWHHNCVAIGTSAGFLEPLEASALVMIEMSANHLAEQMPAEAEQLTPAGRQFNQLFSQRWQRAVDFLKLHYVLSKRRQNAYWQQMTAMETASQQLRDWLTLWQSRMPLGADFPLREELFPAASFQYVLYGMRQSMQTSTNNNPQHLHRAYEQLRHLTHQQLNGLPTNRELLSTLSN
ncbi:MAG: tryptophan 7-halogenase [Gammaproteobacteria bacterium]|nr:tryptophan 7-halogenase [Gammaproteobacteria bacterium]